MRGGSDQLNLALRSLVPIGPGCIALLRAGKLETSHGESPATHGTLRVQDAKHNERLDVHG